MRPTQRAAKDDIVRLLDGLMNANSATKPRIEADKEPREERSCGRSQTLLYDARRRHSTIGYLSPMKFGKLAQLA